MTTPTDRRGFLRLTGGGALALLVAACSSDSKSTSSSSTSTTVAAAGAATATALTVADFDAVTTSCQLLPEQTEGPYYVQGDLLRRDITEGITAVPLRLGLRVVDAACLPIADAVVDIWHCDWDGDYSGYRDGSTMAGDDGGSGTTFLRGSQSTNSDGMVEFLTNYPGWYRGRTVHIHMKVHIGATAVLTSQLFFDDEVSDAVFALEPYSRHGAPDTRNDDDGIASGYKTNGTLVRLKDETTDKGAGKLGLVVIGVSA